MGYLNGPLYLDIASKGMSLAGVMLMIFGQGPWFTVGVFAVFVGVLLGAGAMVAVRRVRAPSGPSRSAFFGAWNRRGGAAEDDGDS